MEVIVCALLVHSIRMNMCASECVSVCVQSSVICLIEQVSCCVNSKCPHSHNLMSKKTESPVKNVKGFP